MLVSPPDPGGIPKKCIHWRLTFRVRRRFVVIKCKKKASMFFISEASVVVVVDSNPVVSGLLSSGCWRTRLGNGRSGSISLIIK